MTENYEMHTLHPNTQSHLSLSETSPIDSEYRPRRLSMHRNAQNRTPRGNGSASEEWTHQSSYSLTRDVIDSNSHVDQIVDKIVEEEECLLGDGVVPGVEFRQDTLKNMPQSLTMKKLVKEKLHLRQKKAKHISYWKQLQLNVNVSSKKCRSNFKDFVFALSLWNGTLKHIEGEFGSATATYFRFFRHLFLLNCISVILCFSFIALPEIIRDTIEGPRNMAHFQFKDLFTGQGYLENTTMFYGFYRNYSIKVVSDLSYSMPRAYFYTMIVVYTLLVIVLSLSMTRSYRINFIETKGGLKNTFAQKVFCTWDFGIATEKAAKLKSSAIFHEFKELLEEELRPQRRTSWREKFGTFMLRLTANLLFLGVVGAIGYSIWLLLELHWVKENDEWSGILNAIVINSVLYIVPVIFSFVSRNEDYRNPRKAFNVTLIRTLLLHAAVIGVLAGFWLFRADEISGCWETKLGQEMYRLIVFEFVFAIIFFALEKIGLCCWAMITSSRVETPEFEVAEHTVHLIYNQALFWLGLLFAPLLSALVVVKYLIMWYFTTCIHVKFSKPSTKYWRASNMQTWFLVITFFTALLIMLALGCMISLIYASQFGPFGAANDDKRYIYDFLKDEILRMEKGQFIWQILAFLLKPGVVAIGFIIMIGFIYYLRARALAQEKMVSVLRDMIIVESKDKDFLLNRIRMLTNEKFTSHNKLDPMRTPGDKMYRPQENQTEFQRDEETVIPYRSEDSTSMSSPELSTKVKLH